MTLKASLFNLVKRMPLRDRGVATGARDFAGHHIRFRLFLTEGFSPDKMVLRLVTIGAFCLGLVVATQALHPCFIDLSMLLSGNMTDIAVQQSRDMLLVR